jgi:hypothetical protein
MLLRKGGFLRINGVAPNVCEERETVNPQLLCTAVSSVQLTKVNMAVFWVIAPCSI